MPAQRPTVECNFYCDCAGHRHDASLQAALEDLRGHALETTVLGSYPTRDPLDI